MPDAPLPPAGEILLYQSEGELAADGKEYRVSHYNDVHWRIPAISRAAVELLEPSP